MSSKDKKNQSKAKSSGTGKAPAKTRGAGDKKEGRVAKIAKTQGVKKRTSAVPKNADQSKQGE